MYCIVFDSSIEMSCTGTAPNNVFKLRGGGDITFAAADADKVYLCKAETVLQNLYTGFTADPAVNVVAPLTTASITANFTPGSCLRILPSTSAVRDLFLEADKLVSTTPGDVNSQIKIQMKNMLLLGSNATTLQPPPALPADFTTVGNFKGIYGLVNAVNLLKSKVNTAIIQKSSSGGGSNSGINIDDETSQRLDYINTFYEKKQMKDTLEEISYRENQIYREKFLYIILMIIGVFVMGSQLQQRYFSDVTFGSFGGLFSGFGRSFGGSSTSFGSLFSSSAYSLKSR